MYNAKQIILSILCKPYVLAYEIFFVTFYILFFL